MRSWSRNGWAHHPVVGDQQGRVDLGTGAVLDRHHAGPMPHFPLELVPGDRVFEPTLTG